MLLKTDLIEELNDILDSLSPKRASEIFKKLTALDLLDLKQAIELKIKNVKSTVDLTDLRL